MNNNREATDTRLQTLVDEIKALRDDAKQQKNKAEARNDRDQQYFEAGRYYACQELLGKFAGGAESDSIDDENIQDELI